MKRSGKRLTTVVALAAALAAVAPASASGQAPKKPSAQTVANRALAKLAGDTRRVPKSALSRRNRTALLRTLARARRAARRNPCRSIRALKGYRRGMRRRVRQPRSRSKAPQPASHRGRLDAQVLKANVALLALPRTRRCGGGKRSTVDEAKTTIRTNTERELAMTVKLPPPQFITHKVGGKDYTEVAMEGMGQTGDPGDPGLPAKTSFFAIPEGADVSVTVERTEGYTIPGVELYPTQRQPVDIRLPPGAPPAETFETPPFTIDTKTFAQNKLFPPAPATGGAMGTIRDARVGGVDTAGGQYNPKTDRLKVFTSVELKDTFGGDNKGTFGDTRMLSPWNEAWLDEYGTLLNAGLLRDRLREVTPQFCGEELLIITSSELRPAADTLRGLRQAQGFSTSVHEVGAGPGQIGATNTDVMNFIRGALNGACLIRPSHVILFGNTAHVPTFLVPCSPGGDPVSCNIASDLPYSLNGVGTDLFADVMLGRLPAPTLDAANALVTKLDTYANNNPAPAGDDFLRHGTVTSYFQPPLHCVLNDGETGAPNCDANTPPVTGHWEINYPANTDTRGFTITAERIRNAMAMDGYTVDRLYTTDDEDVIPLNYWNGTPIPNHLRRPAFDWDANTTDFFNAYNDGRFVILHRDHGWPDGWAEPTLHSGHVPLFTNGTQQPVVFGINCSSAAFDTPSHPSFVELQVLRPDGGAIAGFGDTRVSPSFPNNHMALGFFDAMFPSTVADYGLPETRRLGDILIRGKQYMATQEGFEWHGAGDTYVEHYLYHLLGDPTMQMWAAPPVRFDPDRFRGILFEVVHPEPGDPPWRVRVELENPFSEGTLVTLLQKGVPIGKSIIRNGVAEVAPEFNTSQHDLSIALDQDGAFPAGEPVEGSGPPPPPPPADTALSQSCPSSAVYNNPMTIEGQLDPGFAGAKIVLTYTRPDASTFERTVTTDQSGAWSDTIIPAQQSGQSSPFGEWKVKSRFEGDATHKASSSGECAVAVTD